MKQTISPLAAIILFFSLSFLPGCGDEDPIVKDITEEENNGGTNSSTTQKINQFIFDVMDDVYLWYNYMPNIDPLKETDSKAYFEKLLYKDDHWSYITDDVAEWENSLNGIEKAYGYSLAFGEFVDASNVGTGKYFAVVEFVYPDTPASKAGFKRGDLITKINGASITEANYMDLFESESVALTRGEYTDSGIITKETTTISSDTLNLDPVVQYNILNVGSHRIGYLFYTQYISKYNESLEEALNYFKTGQITDLVLDLRYNPGGHQDAAQYLCSSLAPVGVTDGQKTLVTLQWNDKYQAYWEDENLTEYTTVPFDNTVPVKLGLNKLTVLTGSGTASSSELTITGLDAYMDVVLVGDTTYGKYTGSFTITPADIYKSKSTYESFKNWGLQPIVLRYANVQGVTDFVNGFAPDFYVEDELLPASQLGDLAEPLLKKAVENITGTPIVAMKSASKKFKFNVIDRASSKFDRIKRNSAAFKKADLIQRN